MGTEMDTSGNRTALGVSSDVAQLVGERLRRAREMIGRSTSALSAKIKVREHYLVAIENGQWDELPPGLNGRGLVRIYARELSVSVPELDQAANQAIMPAEQDAQAPYQVGHTREARPEREFGAQRVQQASEPSASRNVEAAVVRTHALSGGTTKQKASPEIHSLSRTQKSNSGSQSSARLGLTPEEQPIDVTTPDVASILGISLDMFDDVSEAKPPTQAIVEESGIEKRMTPTSRGRHSEEEVLPIIGPESAITSAGLLPSDSTSKPVAPLLNDHSVEQSTRRMGPKKHTRELEGFDKLEEISSEVVHLSAAEAIPSEAVVNSSAVEAISSEPVVTSSAVEAISSDAAEPVVLNEPETKEQVSAVANESGISAAESYLKSHAQTSDQLTESAGHADVVGSAKMKWALGILAACVGVLIFGRALLSDPNSNGNDDALVTATTSESIDVSRSDSQVEDSVETQIASDPTIASEPVIAEGAPLQNANELPTPAAENSGEQLADSGEAVNTPSALNDTDSAAESESPSPEESVTVEAPIETGNTVPQLVGTSSALLKLTEAVEIQLTVDGTRVFSGKHKAGDIDLKFDKRLEIFVQDGSKAVLNYSGWNHGALGQAGRKRRIVLNSASFE